MESRIVFDRRYRTKGGYEAYVHHKQNSARKEKFPYVGYVLTGSGWTACNWNENGVEFCVPEYDLILDVSTATDEEIKKFLMEQLLLSFPCPEDIEITRTFVTEMIEKYGR